MINGIIEVLEASNEMENEKEDLELNTKLGVELKSINSLSFDS
jgi:hypothetical protein